MSNEKSLEEAENIVNTMYQNRFEEVGATEDNNIHLGNLDKLEFTDLESASIRLLREELMLHYKIEELQKEYDKLLNIARKMHTWIFLHTGNEKAVYDELGLTDEENALLGYHGQYMFKKKEVENENNRMETNKKF